MFKKLSLFLFLCLFFTKPIFGTWETRFSHFINWKIKKNILFKSDQEFRIYQSPSRVRAIGTLQEIFFSFHKNHSFGFGIENDFFIRRDIPRKWQHLVEYDLFLNQKFNLYGLNIITGFEVIHRSMEREGNWAGIAARIKLELLKLKNGTLYCGNKFYYNYGNLGKYDHNKFVVGTTINMNSDTVIEPYFLIECCRNFLTPRWTAIKVIGLKIVTKF